MVGAAAIRHKIHDVNNTIACGADPLTCYSSDAWRYVTCDHCNEAKGSLRGKNNVQHKAMKRKSPKRYVIRADKLRRRLKHTDNILDDFFGSKRKKRLAFGNTWDLERKYVG